jgi:hypothetical protein
MHVLSLMLLEWESPESSISPSFDSKSSLYRIEFLVVKPIQKPEAIPTPIYKLPIFLQFTLPCLPHLSGPKLAL